jgi:hypothetical protein
MNNRIAILLIVLLTCSACTTVKQGLVGERHENLAPFADTTVEYLGSATLDFRENELIYLREFYDENTREVSRLKDLLTRVDEFRDEIVFYSVELVRISESAPTEADKCAGLADILAGQFRSDYLRQTDMSETQFDDAVARIRAQENFLDALKILQPMITMSGEYFENLVREAENEAVPDARTLFDAAIQEEYGTVIRQLAVIYDRRDELLTGLQKIRAFRGGDDNALQGLNSSNVLPNKSYSLPSSPSDAQLDRTKSYIVQQLQDEEVILELLQRDVDSYKATRVELDAEMAEMLAGLVLARRQIVGWIRAHQQLSNGVRDPGKWFAAVMKVAEGLKRAR